MPDSLDDLDRGLVHALQLDGRASFTKLAAVLGVSDYTVRRRYARLGAVAGLSVHGVVLPQAIGETEWIVRIRCRPDRALAVAEALAKHRDTSWVSLAAGGTEIMTFLRARGDRIELLEKLPKTPAVLDISAQCLLHPFYGGAMSGINKHGFLTPSQARQLSVPVQFGHAPICLDAADHKLFALIELDGRATAKEIGTRVGMAEAKVRRRIDELRRCGALYFDIAYDKQAVLGCEMTAQIWMKISPDKLREAGAEVARHREVAAAAATTGATNLHAYVLTSNEAGLYQYLSETLPGLPGLQQYETIPVLRTLKASATQRQQPQ